MASKTIFLPDVKNGDFLFWTVTSQCQFLGSIRILDDRQLYTRIPKNDPDVRMQVLEQSYKTYTGGPNLRVEIDIPRAAHVYVAEEKGQPIQGGGNTVGYCYNFCVEDYYDADYNDFYINVVAWNKKG